MKSKQSIMISKCLVLALALVAVSALVMIPFIADWYDAVSGQAPVKLPLMVTLYVGDVMACGVLAAMLLLLQRMSKGRVFVAENSMLLNGMAYGILIAAVVLAVFGAMYRPMAIAFAVLLLMVAMVLRTMYHVFAEAVAMKDEQDYTV